MFEDCLLILPCTVKNFNSKDNDTVLNVIVPNTAIEEEEIGKLFTLKRDQVKLNLALAPQYEKENFNRNLEQLDFTVQCPDCHSYDCAVGQKIGFCKTCEKEFSLMRPDVMKKKLKAV